jgi:hypothetical protein
VRDDIWYRPRKGCVGVRTLPGSLDIILELLPFSHEIDCGFELAIFRRLTSSRRKRVGVSRCHDMRSRAGESGSHWRVRD